MKVCQLPAFVGLKSHDVISREDETFETVDVLSTVAT